MTTTTVPADPSRRTLARDLLAAELIKIRSVRSTYWTLLAAAALAVFVAGVIASHWASGWSTMPAAERATFDPLDNSFRGFQIAQLIIGALGVLVIGGEYTSGLIRTTFAAYARRRSVLAAKAAVLGLVALIFGEILAFVSFWITQAVLSGANGADIGISIGAPGALRGTVAVGAYLAVAGLIGVGLGCLLRHTAGALSALFALLFVIPPIVGSLPSPWNSDIGKFLPTGAIGQLAAEHPSASGLSLPWATVVLVAWPVAALAVAAVALTRRDA
jgi:ABC-type transport system involved in multi-copper enzyme maturation permease subunit